MNSLPFILIIIFLLLVIAGLIVWMTLNKPTQCSPHPVYIYGFNSTAPREISGSSGLLTPVNAGLKLTPLSKVNPENQQWRLVNPTLSSWGFSKSSLVPNTLLLEHVGESKYIGPDLSLVTDPEEALRFKIIGPVRDGRVYYLVSGTKSLATKADGSVGLIDFSEKNLPITGEWLIAAGPCQDNKAVPSDYSL